MKQRKIALGPGAASLILIVVCLSMCVLCMLTYISARDALSLSTRSAEMTQQVYTLNEQSERTLARLDALLAGCARQAENQAEYLQLAAQCLPENMELMDNTIAWTESQDERALLCAVRLAPWGEEPRLAWATHTLMVETEDEWN